MATGEREPVVRRAEPLHCHKCGALVIALDEECWSCGVSSPIEDPRRRRRTDEELRRRAHGADEEQRRRQGPR